MKSMLLQFAMVFLTLCCALASSISSLPEIPTSTISAAPALLPNPTISVSSPALSPDEAPLFPSPGGSELSPSDSAMPTIPSSLSPPNPDAAEAFGPDASSPFGSLPTSYGTKVHVSGAVCSRLVLALFSFGFMKIWSM
ncbi:hypothetical protein Leryth_004080 [Lithospermum erythrorhizon]|uniref:Classical arabinogalactan protein 26-like n=1 Tax=Lithospermum erythrorhizon TaxID=34254 RepID=A0AAV3Q3E3_LITER|nr:hypothetical protein Leryth_004080 [Lithospermum erythrorhizon]